MDSSYQAVERPLPRPTTEDYASARLLEALVEAGLALEFLKRGLTRNAAGKVFQAWRAILAALLRLELDRLKAIAKTDEERRWLEERAVPKIPTTKMIPLSQMLSSIGYTEITAWTSMALEIHDYQYYGPDPDMAMCKFRTREEASMAIVGLVKTIVEYVNNLRSRVRWSDEHQRAYDLIKKFLEGDNYSPWSKT